MLATYNLEITIMNILYKKETLINEKKNPNHHKIKIFRNFLNNKYLCSEQKNSPKIIKILS